MINRSRAHTRSINTRVNNYKGSKATEKQFTRTYSHSSKPVSVYYTYNINTLNLSKEIRYIMLILLKVILLKESKSFKNKTETKNKIAKSVLLNNIDKSNHLNIDSKIDGIRESKNPLNDKFSPMSNNNCIINRTYNFKNTLLFFKNLCNNNK